MKYVMSEDNGIYDLCMYYEDTLKENEQIEIGNLLIDTKRNQYYILPANPENEKMVNFFKTEVIDSFISKLGYKVNTDSMVGEVKTYSKELLNQLVDKYDIITTETSEKKLIDESIQSIRSYNLGMTSEYNLYREMR